MIKTPKFFYFDLGNVLLYFSHQLMCRQMAEVAGATTERVWQLLFDTDLERRLEQGTLSNEEFYETFCRETGTRADYDQLERAGSAIFELNAPVASIVAQLWQARYRLGLLSNTSESHFNYFASGRYPIVPGTFEVLALSFRIKAMKPDAEIYQAAAELAGVEPQEIFFVDDIADHVAGAREFGFDAVQYTTAHQLAKDLRARGVRLNY
ncbi:MAG: HAD family phosphatase [Pirellulales bacterium]|nr:HAD family phosphatase [Pirellulales bacterium]